MSEVTVKLSNEDIDAISNSVVLKLKKELKTTPKIHSISDVSNILNCHRNTVIEHIKKGLLTANRKGRNWTVKDEDLQNYINGK